MTLSALKNKLLDPRVMSVVWGVATVVAILMKVLRDPSKYNNFMIFRGVYDHLFASLPLYEPYPLEYGDLNHYGPVFGFIIAPFAALPPWLGMPLWVASMSALLYWAVRKLPVQAQIGTLVLWIAANDLFGAALMQQFNIASAALLVGALAMIERRREGWAALFIVIGTFVKVYGIVGLAFFFFVQRKWRFIGYMALWSVVALLLPLVAVSPDYLIEQYKAWAVDIGVKNGQNMFSLYANVSFVGFVRKVSGSDSYSDMWVIVPAMVMFLVSYLRFGQYKRHGFRLVMLASLLLFVVMFSSGSETSGYVIAAVGVGIWWATLPRRGALEWSLLGLMLLSSFSYNLFTRDFYREVVMQYALRSLPYFAIWLHCIWRLWREDFAASYALTAAEQDEVEGVAAPDDSRTGFDYRPAQPTAAEPVVVASEPESADDPQEHRAG